MSMYIFFSLHNLSHWIIIPIRKTANNKCRRWINCTFEMLIPVHYGRQFNLYMW